MVDNPITDNPFAVLQREVQDNRALILELKGIITQLVSEKKEVLLSPDEARKLFSPVISKSTLNRWQKAGIINRYIKGGRACYKQSEILETAKTKRLYKTNCPVETRQFLQ